MSDTIPYGAMPPEPDQELDKKPLPMEPEKEPEIDYKAEHAKLAKSHENLQKKYGSHTAEVSAVRQQMAELEKQSKEREIAARNTQPPTDYEKLLNDVAQRLEDGELSDRQALVESNKITREWTKAEGAAEKEQLLAQARTEMQGILSQKDSEKVVERFHEKNPDFMQLQGEGAFDDLKAEDPLLDDLAAFWKYKAQTQAQETAAAFEKGKQEALRIKGGSAPAGKVIADAGQSMQTQQKSNRPMSEAEIKASMRASLGV